MFADDTAYYSRRAHEEHSLASETRNEDVREIHEELARLYEALIVQGLIRLF